MQYDLGMVLSGGGARGLSHVGVLEALTEQGVEPQVLAGTSAGAIVAALYAAGYSADEMLEFFVEKNPFRLSKLSLAGPGIFDTDKVVADFLEYFPDNSFEALGKTIYLTATELEFGVTIPIEDQDTAVVAIGTIDAAGREADGTAAVVEHRTGARAEIPHLEQELYAVAAAWRTQADRVAVHHHFLRADGDEACTRRVFDADDLQQALAYLRDAADTIAGWSPVASLEPEHTVGEWCGTCPYESLCKEWRD